MPQPLSRVCPDASIFSGNVPSGIFTARPELAVKVMCVIESWANVEAFMLRCFVQLLGGQSRLAADIYLSLSTNSAKEKAISVAADHALRGRPELAEILAAILKVAQSNGRERDKLAHGTWGVSAQLPDRLLLIDPRDQFKTPGLSPVGHAMVYTPDEFDRLTASNNELCGHAQGFEFILRGHPANNDGRLTRELAESRLLRPVIERARLKRAQQP